MMNLRLAAAKHSSKQKGIRRDALCGLKSFALLLRHTNMIEDFVGATLVVDRLQGNHKGCPYEENL
ncbi:MAG: hypothetical protein IAF08_04685 [Rhizobacter sp.]|nr:hypothetical protein [Chlorobiales bacterium]